jgi:hypothetical protein
VLISVYFPDALAKKIRDMAKNERRSVSSQIIYLVEKGLSDEK